MNRDFVFGAAGLVIAAAYYAMAAAIPQSALADAVGPQGLPKAYAVVLLFLSLMLVARSFGGRGSGVGDRRDANASSQPPTPSPQSPFFRAAGLLIIGAVYLALVPWLGYVVSIGALIFATTWYQGGVVSRQIAIVSLSGAALLWLLFVRLLGIAHPPGLWPALF